MQFEFNSNQIPKFNSNSIELCWIELNFLNVIKFIFWVQKYLDSSYFSSLHLCWNWVIIHFSLCHVISNKLNLRLESISFNPFFYYLIFLFNAMVESVDDVHLDCSHNIWFHQINVEFFTWRDLRWEVIVPVISFKFISTNHILCLCLASFGFIFTCNYFIISMF